jgi:hypothetical protein
VVHRLFISPAKSFAIVSLGAPLNVGMAILFAVIHIRTTMLVVILPCSFDAVVIPLTFNFAKLAWGILPVTTVTTLLRIR